MGFHIWFLLASVSDGWLAGHAQISLRLANQFESAGLLSRKAKVNKGGFSGSSGFRQ